MNDSGNIIVDELVCFAVSTITECDSPELPFAFYPNSFCTSHIPIMQRIKVFRTTSNLFLQVAEFRVDY